MQGDVARMKMPTFDRDTHTYWMGSKQIPSVTTILREAGIISTEWFNEFARDRGSAIHSAIHLYNQEDLNEFALDPIIVPYLESWKKFLAISGF